MPPATLELDGLTHPGVSHPASHLAGAPVPGALTWKEGLGGGVGWAGRWRWRRRAWLLSCPHGLGSALSEGLLGVLSEGTHGGGWQAWQGPWWGGECSGWLSLGYLEAQQGKSLRPGSENPHVGVNGLLGR